MAHSKPAHITGFFALVLLMATLWCVPLAVAQAPVGISIEAQPIEGATARADTAAITKRLSEAAIAQAAKSLDKPPFASRGLRLSGVIRLPLSLPPRVIGLRAHDRKGNFVTANFTLHGADGKSLAEQSVTLKWDDVRWTQGARPWKRNRALDEVLEEATRKAVARAAWQISRQRGSGGENSAKP